MKLYHYTTRQNAVAILSGTDAPSGLRPRRRFVPFNSAHRLPEQAHEGAVFGLR